ncbi:uncharacterized protein TNCV_107411 [Trichonephila clavipes]|nr:uncharacterized protein TNCV_107411 [Trichonephila clavipes]
MIPHHDLDSSMRELFGDISLADPAFYKSSPIDVLLGVDLTLPLLKGQTLSLGKDKPFAIRSELGWIIGGKANSSGQNSFHVNHIQLVSDQLINKCWDENGRYTVKLPFHTPPTRLVSNFQCSHLMFRQIKVHEKDVDWQRMLWRDSPTEPIREYRLTIVTYGMSSAPFLSTRTLRQLAIDEQEIIQPLQELPLVIFTLMTC